MSDFYHDHDIAFISGNMSMAFLARCLRHQQGTLKTAWAVCQFLDNEQET